MFLFDIIVLFDIYDILYMIYILNKAPNHKFLPCLYCKVKTIQYYREAQQSNDPPLSKHKATVGKKNSLLTGRNFQRNQAQKGAAICHDCRGWEEWVSFTLSATALCDFRVSLFAHPVKHSRERVLSAKTPLQQSMSNDIHPRKPVSAGLFCHLYFSGLNHPWRYLKKPEA